MFLRLIFDICFSLCYICNVIDYKKFFMKKVTHMSDDAFLFEEISVPVSDFSAGLATGIGFGLAILALAGC